MNPKRIVINGKSYNSIEEMPEDVRKQYEQAMSTLNDKYGTANLELSANNILADKNKNGIPDIIENTGGERIVASAIKILVEGREFNSLDELPPDARAKYEKAMAALDADQNGIPDFVEGMIGTRSTGTSVSSGPGIETPRPASRTSIPVSPTITPDTSNGSKLVLLGVMLLLICAAGGILVWFAFLR